MARRTKSATISGTPAPARNSIAKGSFVSPQARSSSKPPAKTESNSRKRKLVDFIEHYESEAAHTTATKHVRSNDVPSNGQSPSSIPPKAKGKQKEEKRLKMYRKKATGSFLQKLERAMSQRMIVINRTRSEVDGCPKEDIDIVGATGNIYTVTIDKLPSCTCPDSLKGNECKHKVYALHTVLKAPEHLQYQLAFLSNELHQIFKKAPPLPTDVVQEDGDGSRKPVEGECPICYMDFDEEHNELVWCKAACGNNMHKSCFEQWAASQRGNTVNCVYCRTPWEMDAGDLSTITKSGTMSEGYLNVAEHFGMSRARDYTSYHQPWVRRTFGMGW